MPAEPIAPRERRLLRRKPLKAGVTVTLRKGALGLGPNLTAGGVTLSDEGISLRVIAELAKADEDEISLTGVGRSKPMKLMADIRWCKAGDEETFVVGAKLRKRIAYVELAGLV